MEFFKKYWKYIAIGALIIVFLILIALISNNNSNLRASEKEAKSQIKALHKLNEDLEKEIKLNQDSIKIFHDLAVFHNNKDTIYLKQIKYLENKTNEEISHYNSLTLDSQYVIFTELAEEYIKTGFNPDK